MREFVAFTKKEFIESWRTYKLPIMLAVFFIFGMLGPLLAKIMPELLSGLAGEGISIEIAEPTAMDAWGQFFKNVGQMGILSLIIVFCGLTATELARGTLVNMLTKGMKRRTVVLSKFTAATAIWAASYLLCLAVSAAYTAYFWGAGTLHHTFLAFFSLWLFGELPIALLIFGGILFKGVTGSLLLCGGAIIGLSILNVVPALQKYNPISLGNTLGLLSGAQGAGDFVPAAIVCTAAAAAIIAASIAVFNKKQI
jgi:ABC-2 type transport system permease protein